MAARKLYRVIFVNQGKIYEIYARKVEQDKLYGFVEVSGLTFGQHTEVVVDPAEERLRSEFEGVESTWIPMHAVIRIDQVDKQGSSKITSVEGSASVTPFPGNYYGPGGDGGKRG